jgi:hypothetical protein
MLAILYYLVKRGDWVSSKEIEAFTKLGKVMVSVGLRRLFRLDIVEKRYVPCYRGVMALWRVREDALNGLNKEQVLNMLKKHIEMCLASTESSGKLSTATTATTDVVIDLPGGSSIGLSFNECRELIARVNGFTRSWNELISSLPQKLRQALVALYRHGIIYYSYSSGVWRVDFRRLLQVLKVYRAPYKP